MRVCRCWNRDRLVSPRCLAFEQSCHCRVHLLPPWNSNTIHGSPRVPFFSFQTALQLTADQPNRDSPFLIQHLRWNSCPTTYVRTLRSILTVLRPRSRSIGTTMGFPKRSTTMSEIMEDLTLLCKPPSPEILHNSPSCLMLTFFDPCARLELP